MVKRKAIWTMTVAVSVAVVGAVGASGNGPLVLTPVVTTAPLFNYEGAPATPDADDPAIWVNRDNPRHSLVVGTAKDAGLLVYDMSGQLVQAMLPPNAPHVSPADPPTPAGINLDPDKPCADSDSQQTFGRFNNVDIAYGVRLESRSGRVDVAVVSDRGCDRIRFYKIDPTDPDGPLVDITAPNVPRVFPTRYEQPSVLQPSGAVEGWRDNPVDDQNTVYGLTVSQGDVDEMFVSERERGLVRQLQIVAAPGGTLTYRPIRTFLFKTTFPLRNESGAPYDWTPCREAALEEPQSEGVVFDRANQTLYVAFETIGLYKLTLSRSTSAFVTVTGDRLIEPVRSFGQAYHATPDDDEFECAYSPSEPPAPGDVVAAGSDANVGRFLEADLEGLSIIASIPGRTLLLASSQGDSSFHFYELSRTRTTHRGAFFVEGVGDTDGVHYVPVPIGRQFPLGLLVIQNGEAPEPPDTGDVNGFEFDGATQFLYLDFADPLKALLP
jgi:3-phytase